jgi:hypothetical protein
MKKVFLSLAVVAVLTVVSCKKEVATDEVSVDTTAVIVDTTAVVVDSTTITTDTVAAPEAK